MLKYLSCLAAGVLFIAAQASPATAQATRTWVSGVGDDANPCSRTAPCKTFAGAISKTAAGGEINTLDPGGFGAVTITKPISIISRNIEAGVLVSGTNAIVINLATTTDKVLLEGLNIDGVGTGLNGVQVISGGEITIRDCSIRNFTGDGVNAAGTSISRVFMDNVQIINNTGNGVNIDGFGGSITHSAFLRNSVVDRNGSAATRTNGPVTLVLIGSTLSGSSSSIIATGGAAVLSYGNNVLRNAGAPTAVLPLQ